MISEIEEEILSRALNKVDNTFNSIIYASKHASVYVYRHGQWEKLNIEGTFVLYQTRRGTAGGLYIFNRKTLKDFKQMFTEETDLGFNDSLITIYNRGDEGVYGIWFYETEIAKQVYMALKGFFDSPFNSGNNSVGRHC